MISAAADAKLQDIYRLNFAKNRSVTHWARSGGVIVVVVTRGPDENKESWSPFDLPCAWTAIHENGQTSGWNFCTPEKAPQRPYEPGVEVPEFSLDEIARDHG